MSDEDRGRFLLENAFFDGESRHFTGCALEETRMISEAARTEKAHGCACLSGFSGISLAENAFPAQKKGRCFCRHTNAFEASVPCVFSEGAIAASRIIPRRFR